MLPDPAKADEDPLKALARAMMRHYGIDPSLPATNDQVAREEKLVREGSAFFNFMALRLRPRPSSSEKD